MVRAAIKQYRWFSVTIQLSSTVFAPVYFSDIIDYAKGQLEVGATGNLHYQVAIHTTKKITIAGLSKEIFGHLEGARNIDCLKDYVWKDDETSMGGRFEYGNCPVNRNSAVDWALVRQNASAQRWSDIPDDILVRHASSLRILTVLLPEAPPFREDQEVFYYWGDSGAGKSRLAFEESGYKEDPASVYIKGPTTKWFDRYTGQAKCIIDDFEGDVTLAHLKRWLDVYPCSIEVKGSAVPLKVTKWWITSNYSPDEILDIMAGKRVINQQSRIAFKRRLKVKHFSRLM